MFSVGLDVNFFNLSNLYYPVNFFTGNFDSNLIMLASFLPTSLKIDGSIPPKSYAEYLTVPHKKEDKLTKNPECLREILFGIMLSDGSLSKRQYTSGTNARFRFGQSTINSEYFFHVFNLFYNHISRGSVRFTHTYNKITDKFYHAYHLETISLPFFTEFYQMFYLNRIKIIPINLDLLTPLALAHFIMGDGSFRPNRINELNINTYPKVGGLILCTENFTADDNKRLQAHLQDVLGIDCSLQKGHKADTFRVYIKVSSLPLVRELVSEFMVPSMLYKLGL